MGPLPATVYRRRRLVAIASAVSVIVLIAWGVAALASRGGPPAETETASRVAVSAPQEASPSPSPAAPPPAAPQPGTAGPTTSAPAPTPSAAPRPSTPVPTPAAAPPPDPVPCTNDMLAVSAQADRPENRVGERVVLRLVISNTSEQPCVRDLDPARQEIVVRSGDGGERLWSSNDCSTAKREDVRTLVPGRPVAFTVRWAGRTSAPGCPAKREPVPAGEYRLMTRLDELTSRPTHFTRRP